MKHALIIGASGGIGAAIETQLGTRGWAVQTLSRSADGLEITDENSVRSCLAQFDTRFDLVFVATGVLDGAGAPPEKSLKALSAEAMQAQFAINTIGPALLIKHALRLLPRDRRAVLAVLSARVGSIGDNRLGGWYSYRAAKAALNQVLRCASIEIGRTHPKAACVALHPGTVATRFTANYTGHDKVTAEQAAQNLLAVLEQLDASHSGGFFDWSGARVPW